MGLQQQEEWHCLSGGMEKNTGQEGLGQVTETRDPFWMLTLLKLTCEL